MAAYAVHGQAHFESVGGLPQPESWKNDIFGVFVQGSVMIGVYLDANLGPPHGNF
jgi:hypothetical protein